MASKGLEQLLSLQSSLNSLIDAYARAPGASSLCALDEVGKEVSLEPVDPRLAKISATLNNMSAVVLGDKLPFQRAFEYHIITALHVAYDAHVEETLREARERGSTAVAVDTLAKPTGIEPQKLARCLRLLAAYHIFAESEPDEFSPNRCSASLDSGLAIEEILRDPLAKYSSSKGGLGAMVGHFAEEGLRAASFTSEALLHPSKPGDYGFSRAYDRDKIWDYFGREANEAKRKRFQCGFGALSKCFDREESILRGFPWRDIPEGSIVCDVAGRTGNVSLEIASANPHLRFVVQDQEKVIEQMAVPFWETPGAKPYKDRVELIAHDFFDPQPVKGAAVYLIRLALHGFADDQVVKILTNVAAAASPSSRLVIVEATYESLAAPGAYPAQSTIPYLLDLQMLTMINVTERLEQQYKRLALEAGWKLAKTWKTGSDGLTDGTFRHYEFVLAAC